MHRGSNYVNPFAFMRNKCQTKCTYLVLWGFMDCKWAYFMRVDKNHKCKLQTVFMASEILYSCLLAMNYIELHSSQFYMQRTG